MIIGLCAAEASEISRAIGLALPDATIVMLRGEHRYRGRVDVLVPLDEPVTADLLDELQPALIQQIGIGLDSVDLYAAQARGIPVSNLSGEPTGNAEATAEIALLHLLMLLRRFRESQASVETRQVGAPLGQTLHGKVVTVLGVGAVGTAVISRLAAFGAIALGVGRRSHPQPAAAALLPPERYLPVSKLHQALARSTALIVCVPLTDWTTGLVGTAELRAMPPGGYLVNVARGAVVDYAAMLTALTTNHLAGAGLDVAPHEPIDPHDRILRLNVSFTPHLGAATTEVYQSMARAFARKVRAARIA